MKTLYQILGVRKNASAADLKKAHRDLARLHHPDLGGNPEKFMEIDRAYKTLRDKTRRKLYDETGEIDSKSVLSEMDQMRSIMGHVYSQMLSNGSAFDGRISVIDLFRKVMKQNRTDFREKLASYKDINTKLEDVMETISYEGEKENIFARITADHIAKNQITIDELRHNIKIAGLALDELQNYRSFARAVHVVQMYMTAGDSSSLLGIRE